MMLAMAHPLALWLGLAVVAVMLVGVVVATAGWDGAAWLFGVLITCSVAAFAIVGFVSWCFCGTWFGVDC